MLPHAEARVAEIYHYSFDRWGQAQADRYYHGLFDAFDAIASRTALWRPIPAEFDVVGHFCRYQSHLIYWKVLEDGSVGIVTVLNERMAHADFLSVAFND